MIGGERHHILQPKGVPVHHGMFENNYIVTNMFAKFKKKKKYLYRTSLDISNAFVSLPHWVIFEAPRLAGVVEELIRIVKDIYNQATTLYRTSEGTSTPRVATTRVKQGDPLSGVLFILAIYFLLRKKQNMGSSRDPSNRNLFHYILPYADDVLILDKDMGILQALLHLINNLATKIRLHFNSNKCIIMHYSTRPPAWCRNTIFQLNGDDFPCISDGVPALFLEKLIGAFFAPGHGHC